MSALTTVVIPTAARCAAWRCTSGAAARNGRAARFGTFKTTIRAAAARVVGFNLPNLGALPFLAGASLAQRQAAQRATAGMTTAVNALTGQAVIVVDLMCNDRSYQTSNYSSDGFHPNDSGYAFIAAEVVLAATSAAYPPPRLNCPQMSVVPPP